MAGRNLMTLDVRELMLRFRRGQSCRAIARDLCVSRITVRKYRDIAKEEGLLEGAFPSMSKLDELLRDRRSSSEPPAPSFRAEPFRELIVDLRSRGVEGKAIHQHLVRDHDYEGSYSSIHRFIKFLEPRDPTGFVRVETVPGEEAQVDFGFAGQMIDPATGKLRKAWVFVMTLSSSRHQYATFVV